MDSRMREVVTYLVSLIESARRFAHGLDPFDFGNENVVEAMLLKNGYFIENDDDPSDESDESYRIAHCRYRTEMLEAGWTLGQEDYNKKTLSDLKPYDQLSNDQKREIAFRAAVIHSVKGFYHQFKGEIEKDTIENMNMKSDMMQGFTIFGNNTNISKYIHMVH